MTQPHNPLRAALERFGRERGQPQPSQWQRDEQESRDALARGEGVTFENAEQAIKWLQEPEQGQPQQEPAEPIGNRLAREFKDDPEYIAAQKEIEDGEAEQQERQAGGHVHERGQKREIHLGTGNFTSGMTLTDWQCKTCDIRESQAWWDGYKEGLHAATYSQP